MVRTYIMCRDFISIHAPHEGERLLRGESCFNWDYISIHAPHEGERRRLHEHIQQLNQHFNPRSPRGGATQGGRRSPLPPIISIHAPHEGERPYNPIDNVVRRRFQSTLPTRGSDRAFCIRRPGTIYFNPRSPRGGATSPSVASFIIAVKFQSTLPTRGSDTGKNTARSKLLISIHAPHEGERPPVRHTRKALRVFQSTLPTRGSDDYTRRASLPNIYFNPRSPRGGATEAEFRCQVCGRISIHAPHEGERQ